MLFPAKIGGNFTPRGGFPLVDFGRVIVLLQPFLGAVDEVEQGLVGRLALEERLAPFGLDPRDGVAAV